MLRVARVPPSVRLSPATTCATCSLFVRRTVRTVIRRTRLTFANTAVPPHSRLYASGADPQPVTPPVPETQLDAWLKSQERARQEAAKRHLASGTAPDGQRTTGNSNGDRQNSSSNSSGSDDSKWRRRWRARFGNVSKERHALVGLLVLNIAVYRFWLAGTEATNEMTLDQQRQYQRQQDLLPWYRRTLSLKAITWKDLETQWQPAHALVKEYLLASKRNLEEGKWWTTLTMGFAHWNRAHLLNNMIILWGFGYGVAHALGARYFTLFYLGASVVGTLTHVGFVDTMAKYQKVSPEYHEKLALAPLCGASTACYGIGTMWAMLFYKYSITFPLQSPMGKLTRGAALPIGSLISCWLAYHLAKDIRGMYTRTRANPPPLGGTAYEAHLAGILFGVLVFFARFPSAAKRAFARTFSPFTARPVTQLTPADINAMKLAAVQRAAAVAKDPTKAPAADALVVAATDALQHVDADGKPLNPYARKPRPKLWTNQTLVATPPPVVPDPNKRDYHTAAANPTSRRLGPWGRAYQAQPTLQQLYAHAFSKPL